MHRADRQQRGAHQIQVVSWLEVILPLYGYPLFPLWGHVAHGQFIADSFQVVPHDCTGQFAALQIKWNMFGFIEITWLFSLLFIKSIHDREFIGFSFGFVHDHDRVGIVVWMRLFTIHYKIMILILLLIRSSFVHEIEGKCLGGKKKKKRKLKKTTTTKKQIALAKMCDHMFQFKTIRNNTWKIMTISRAHVQCMRVEQDGREQQACRGLSHLPHLRVLLLVCSGGASFR